MLIIETSIKYNGFGKVFGTVGGKPMYRIWIGWIAITWTKWDFYNLHNHIAKGNTIWIKK